VWGDRKAKDITHRDIVLLLDKVGERGGAVRQRLASIITMMFETAITRGFLEKTPVRKIKSTASKPRKRILTDDEIKVVWSKSMEIGAMPAAKHGLRLLLLTAQRRGELNKAVWMNVDLEGRLWKIPEIDSKNGESNCVDLSELALEQFKSLKASSGDSPHVMTSRNKGKIKKYNANSFSNIPKNYKHFGLAHWILHDLRRTACSKMLALGVAPHVAERILNHKQEVLAETYHNYDYAKERRQAFKLWGEWIENLVK
jgi:integrase